MFNIFSFDPKSGFEMGSSMHFIMSANSALITSAILSAEQFRK